MTFYLGSVILFVTLPNTYMFPLFDDIALKEVTHMNNELLKLTAHQVQERGFTKCVLAIGSCEAHGQHLAEGTDTLVSYMLACRIAEAFDDMLVLPPITVGYSGHYDAFPFTLTLGYDTITQVIYDLLDSVLRNGMKHIFLLNGHDGNIAPIEIASRKIKEKYPEARIVSLPAWWVTAGELLPKNTFEVWDGLGHAGEGESSIAYYLYPQWNEPELAKGFVPDNLPEFLEVKWDFSELTSCAATGDPSKATAEKGRMMTEVLTEACVNTIRKLDACGWEYRTGNI